MTNYIELTSLNYNHITKLHLFSRELGNLWAKPPLKLMGNRVPKLFESTAYSVRSVFRVGTTLRAWQERAVRTLFLTGFGENAAVLFVYAGCDIRDQPGCENPFRCAFSSLPIDDPLFSQRDIEEPFHSQSCVTCVWVFITWPLCSLPTATSAYWFGTCASF